MAIESEHLEAEAAPAGTGPYVVRQGDCLLSIAKRHGFSWETLWNLPENAELRNARSSPTVLLPGDRIHIPLAEPKGFTVPTGQRHRFVAKTRRAMFRVRVLKRQRVTTRSQPIWNRDSAAYLDLRALAGEEQAPRPRANEPYVLNIEGRSYEGTTDPAGQVNVPIGGNEESAHLIVGEGSDREEYELRLGHLDPIETPRGIQQRLNNLAYPCGRVDGIIGPRTRGALRSFQRDQELPITGRADGATKRTLQERHGC